MAVATGKYCFEDGVYRKILYSHVKRFGFLPEKNSEIFVSAIPAWASVTDVAQFFEQVGELFQVKLLMEPGGIHNRGYAFVTYMDAKLARQAMAQLKNKSFIGNQCLLLQISVNNCRIFVGGLPPEKTKDRIWQELMATFNIKNIVDVITYRNYCNPAHNRGFVFLEFRTHEEASHFRAKYSGGKLILFGKQLLVDWSVPILETQEDVMTQVKIIFLRNLDVTMSSEDFGRQIYKLVNKRTVEKVYKFKNFAYIHLNTRSNAEQLLKVLTRIYHGTEVEVTWAKPPNKFSERAFREKALQSRKVKSPISAAFPFERSSPLLSGMHSLSLADDNRSDQLLMGSSRFSERTPASSLSSAITLDDICRRNIFTNTERVTNLSNSVNIQNQPSSSGIFDVPILPRNLTPFHQIQPYYSTQSFEMPHPRPLTNNPCVGSRMNRDSSFSAAICRPTRSTTEIRTQDMEAMVNSVLNDL